MKNIVDSCAWLTYFADEKNAQIFAEPIEDIENLVVPTVVLTEVFKVIYRQTDENTALQAISYIQQGEIVSLDDMLSIDAGLYGVQYKLPLAALFTQHQKDMMQPFGHKIMISKN